MSEWGEDRSERMVIGGLLAFGRPAVADCAKLGLESRHFTRYGRLYERARQIAAEEATPATIFERIVSEWARDPRSLASTELPVRVNEAAAELVDMLRLATHEEAVRYHAGEVLELGQRKAMEEAAEEFRALASNPATTPEELDEARRKLLQPNQTKGQAFVSSREALERLSDEIHKELTGERPARLEIGIPMLDDQRGGIDRGEITLVGAKPGTGKTALAVQACEAVGRLGLRSLVFSCEMSPEKLMRRLLQMLSRGASYYDGKPTKQALEAIKLHAAEARDLPMSVYQRGKLVVEDMVALAMSERDESEEELGLIVVDYVQRSRTRSRVDNQEQNMLAVSTQLQELGRMTGVAVLILSQLNEDNQAKYARALEEDASLICLLDKEEGIRIAKDRNGGMAGELLPVVLNGEQQRFYRRAFQAEEKARGFSV